MIPKIIFFTLMLIVIIGCQQEIEESVQVMQKSSINEYNWNSRLLLINVDNNENELYKSLLKFQIEKYCEFEDRKLIGIKFKDGSNDAYFTPDFISNQYGMWLVGYDGTVKEFSEDQSFLYQIFDIIDQMPMRQNEIQNNPSKC
tara:strand:- start:162 stop:593 length:432 start_codon:yes stop_codon:yes gene_type:complete